MGQTANGDHGVIVVNIIGGLGNQMFQYACGQALAAQTGQEVRYVVDSLGQASQARDLELESAFGIRVPIASSADLSGTIGNWRRAPVLRRILARPQMEFLRGTKFIAEQCFSYLPDLASRVAAGGYLHGYWQSERYFGDAVATLNAAFRFKGDVGSENQGVIARMSQGPSIGIHVRRGDYVTNANALATHGVLPPDHYKDCIGELRSKAPQARVFAFSDDPDWVKDTILRDLGNAECVAHNTGPNSFRDMQLMTKCNSLVIANSSFSWWAAWLNDQKGKTIIAPRHWFADPALDASAVVPDTWLRR